MWLLRTRETDRGEVEVVEFADYNKIPQYAILSHRWAGEEVTLQDIRVACAATRKGYRKVKDCCELARRRGLEYIWMDTCCIDKTSSVELSEAINSMYRWYQDAYECYAYLADVPSESEFPNSVWFTRGWTLQELIAPSNLIFFNERWEELGNKKSLCQLISHVTGIPVRILSEDDDLESSSIAQKMSWAAKRQTTKVEDRAYCLMGIFGINMPLLYGEGELAFIRLQEEIMKVSDDYTIFAWKSSDQNPGGMLATSVDAFEETADVTLGHSYSTTNTPWTVNNQGIHLELPYMAIGHQGLGLGILPCTRGKHLLLAIFLRDVSFTMERFERVWCEKLQEIDISNFRPSQYPARRVCVRQRRLAILRTKPPRKYGQGFASTNRDGFVSEDGSPSPNWGLFDELMSFVHILEPMARQTSKELAGIGKLQSADLVVTGENRRSPLLNAAGGGYVEEIRLLLARRNIQVNLVDEDGRTPLSHAAGKGHVKVVWLLLAQRNIKADWNDQQGRTPLSIAAEAGHVEVVWLLLARSDVEAHSADKTGRTPLIHAVRQGRMAVVNILLARDDVRDHLKDDEGRTPLSHASECGQQDIVRILLARSDIRPDIKDKSGRTPLWWAAVNGYEDIVKLLLEGGANPDPKGENGQTALFGAAKNGHIGIVGLLLERGADPELKDNSGWTPLYYATWHSFEDLVKLLLEGGADTESKNDDGWTPLYCAASNGYEAVVKLLLKGGADPESRDPRGRPVLRWAARNGHEGIVNLLREAVLARKSC